MQAKVWTYDWLRCNSCGAIFTAPLPTAAGPPEKFDDSVTSTIGLLRYGFGMPFNRLENLQECVNIPLPASTQWDLINRSAPHLEPVFIELIKEAATGEIFYNDDTTMRILELIAEQARAGTTVLYTTHYMEEAEELCDELGIIDHGRLIAEGTLARASRSRRVRNARITTGGQYERIRQH